MGVKNLWDILETCKKTLPLHHLQNKRMCIDLSCWMVQLQKVSKSHNCFKEKVYLKGLFHRLRALLALNCSLIFVTDGSIPAIKLSTYRRRLNMGNEQTNRDRDEKVSENVSSLRRNMGSEFSCMIKEAKMLGMSLGIPCLDGIEEAEAQCALLNSESLCDGCFTSDSDIFLFGAKTVYRDICLGDGGYVVCYEMEDIQRRLGFGRNSLIALALLLGSDYSQGVHGFGQESACHIVRSAGDDVILERIVSGGLPFLKKTKGSKKQGKPPLKANDKENLDNHGGKHNSEGTEQFFTVINAFMKPKCHSADSEVVLRVLAQHPFERPKLHHVCSQLFAWPPEKADEYILPKIAERDLRRFANLRSTSSALGLELPLSEIPVKCPVSEIIKRRKVQGRECFEVSWQSFEGLETTIVPGDLLESACPEKIREFDEKKKQKQPKPSQRKQKTSAAMAELDLKLQDLVLEINSGSWVDPNPVPSPPRQTMPNKRGDNDVLEDPNSMLNRDNTCSSSSSASSTIDFIDLLSPSPATRSRVDVVCLSDSETEASPEHERKARELRLFISSIGD